MFKYLVGTLLKLDPQQFQSKYTLDYFSITDNSVKLDT